MIGTVQLSRALTEDEMDFVVGGKGEQNGGSSKNPTSVSQMTWGQLACYTAVAMTDTSAMDQGKYSETADQACNTNMTGTNPGNGSSGSGSSSSSSGGNSSSGSSSSGNSSSGNSSGGDSGSDGIGGDAGGDGDGDLCDDWTSEHQNDD